MKFYHVVGLLGAANAFIPAPQGLDVVLSEKFPGAKISYKPTTICETTPGVRSFAGYVKLPKSMLPDATRWDDGQAANIFFWFFEARNNPTTAPTSIFIGGGPGTTSFEDSSLFPCSVTPNSTTLNKLSFNDKVNMLYIDQPAGTGFSFVDLVNGAFNHVTQEFAPGQAPQELNLTHVPATLDRNSATVPSSTMAAARTLWRFAQVWFNEFPERPNNTDLSIWAVSYGGFYAPVTTSYILSQNNLIKQGRPSLANATVLPMKTLGILNGCMDSRALAPGVPEFAYNNTYGIQAYPRDIYDEAVANVTRRDTGCLALIDSCRGLAAKGDPEHTSANQTVNEACFLATQYCYMVIENAYARHSNLSPFDVTMSLPAEFPILHQEAFFNQPWVQTHLGVPVNFTMTNPLIQVAFFSSGDPMRVDMSFLSHALQSGVNVAMVFGDRDYRCNWYSAEDTSLAVPFGESDKFRTAGYTSIVTNSTYSGGLVREHGGLSFSRVFQAGHSAAAYQPETVAEIFERAMFRRDVATGHVDLTTAIDYATSGPADIRGVLSSSPASRSNVCTVYSAPFSCTPEQLQSLADGSAVVENWVVVKPEGISVKGASADASYTPGRGEESTARGVRSGLLSTFLVYLPLLSWR